MVWRPGRVGGGGGGGALLLLLLLHVLGTLVPGARSQASFANVTLRANGGDLSVVVFLPDGLKPGEATYYKSTRFEWGSMIGAVTRTSVNFQGREETHVLYGTRNWRVPHDPYWPESGVGLASEFGVGDDGSFCTFFCGWDQVNEVTNGVLGYGEAKTGETFLKLGVGELVKGSCSTCDSAEDFKFNSPYQFGSPPVWTLEEGGDGRSAVLRHEAVLRQHGYRLEKRITLNDDQLLVRNTLTNLGRVPFATAWYSHHFFTCDSRPVGSGYAIDVDLAGTKGAYDEPGTWSWSTPLADYAKVVPRKDRVSIEMQRGVEAKVRIKAEFAKDPTSHGEFTIRACNTAIRETIPEVAQPHGGVSMYAYNLYIESGTFSPEPQIYMRLYPGESRSWTQQLDFADYIPPSSSYASAVSMLNPFSYHLSLPGHSRTTTLACFCLAAFFGGLLVQSLLKRRRQTYYVPIPDHHHDDVSNPSHI
jgi:hypothetical protein